MSESTGSGQDYESRSLARAHRLPNSRRTIRGSSARFHDALHAHPGSGAADRAGRGDPDLRAAPGRAVLLAGHADADPAADADRRRPRRGADADHPDRGDRPLGRRHGGLLLGDHGTVHLPLRDTGSGRDRLRPRRRHRHGRGERLARQPGEAAALHRHARHVADRPGRELPLFHERDDPQSQDIDGRGAATRFLGTRFELGGAVITLGVVR